MKQETLQFYFNNNKSDFFCVSKKNYFAYKSISDWPNWSNKFIFLYGPKDCGKSHISNLWIKKSNAVKIDSYFFERLEINENQILIEKNNKWLIEDIDEILDSKILNIDMKILNFLNLISKEHCFLLITSRNSPKNMFLSLEDLLSRLNSFLVVEIKEPDEDLLKKIIIKGLQIHQIEIDDEHIDYLINRMERTYTSAKKIAYLIDKISLEKKINISKDFLKKILDNF